MAISSIAQRTSYVGNGATALFAYPYGLTAFSDLLVYLFDANVEPVATTFLGSGTYDYSIGGTPDAVTGLYHSCTVTFNTAPPGGYLVVLMPGIPATQELALTATGPLPALALNTALDRLTLLVQQLAVDGALALSVPPQDSVNTVLPAAAARANQLLGFNSSGAPMAYPLTTVSSLPVGIGLPQSAAAYGALGTADDTAVIQAAINFTSGAGGGTVWLPAGTFLVDGLLLQQGVVIEGAARGASVLKGKAGGSGNIIATVNYSTLTGTNSSGGPSKFGLRNVSIDGNKANRTGGHAVAIYGFDFILDDVEIYNAFADCLRSEWGTYGGSPPTAQPTGNFMEARITKLRTFGAGGNGLTFRGPHDSLFSQCLSYINAGYGMLFDQSTAYEASGAVLDGCHCFGNTLYGVVVNCLVIVAGTLTSESNAGGGIIVQNPYGQIIGDTLYTFNNTGVGILMSAGSGNSQFKCVTTGNTGDGLQVDTYGNQISAVSNSNGGNGLSIGGAATQNQFCGLRVDANTGYGVLHSSGAANNQLTNVVAVANLAGGIVVPDGANGLRVDGLFSANTGTQAALGALGSQCRIDIAVFANTGQVGWSGTPGNNFVSIAGGGAGAGVTSTHAFAT